ncbi:MAG TPA: ROK family protein [Kofleriaceae bacterium]|nr:ROK family protein [Kofleriaceae bacterium]
MIALGLDIGASHVRAAWRDGGAAVPLGTWRTPEPGELTALVRRIAGALAAPIARLGVGLAGALDAAGAICEWPNRPEYVGFAFTAACAEACSLAADRVAVIDDCAAAALGEHHARGRAGASTLYVGVGTGIGAGAVLGGRLHLGARRRAFGLGHLPLRSAGDVACRCGRRGCLQAVASGRVLAERARAEGWTGGLLGQAAATGDSRARVLITDAARSLGEAIAGPAALLDPDCVVIGGGVAEAGDRLLEPLVASLRRHGSDVPVELARLGAHGGAIGAAWWADPSSIQENLPTCPRNYPSTPE